MSELKYKELAQELRNEITTGVYRSGQRLPGELELAAKLSCSRQTVRQAIGLLVDEGLVYRMQGSGTYVRNGPVRRTPTRNIAVVTTYIGEHIFPAILHGIEETLTENAYTFMLSATRNRVDNERRILSDLLGKPIDGLIVEGTKTALPNPNIDLYNAFAQQGIPVVFINGYYPDIKSPVYVVADDRRGGRMATEYLLKKGHRRIAGIFKSDDIQGHRRYAGFIQTMRAAGIEVSDDNILWYTTETRDMLIDACALDVIDGCTAAVCYNDEAALELVHVFTEKDVAPDCCELVSFDNSVYAQISPVHFLSLQSPKERLGCLAAEKMIHILDLQQETSTVLPWTIPDTES